MYRPRVSVVIPFYSSEPGKLSGAVQSALSQTLESIEVIVIDDCSPINAESELKTVCDPRLKVIRHENNLWGGMARNTGVQNATGEFIAFLDSDDEWYPEKLQRQLDFWKDNGCSQNTVLFCMCEVIEGKRVWVRPTRGLGALESVSEYIFIGRQLLQTSGIFLIRELALISKFDDLKRHQDYQFCLSLEKHGAKFELIPEVLYQFIQTPKANDYEFSLLFLEYYGASFDDSVEKGFVELVVIRSMIKQRRFWHATKLAFKYRCYTSFLGFFTTLR
jgi:glycosyltransferase involved in cell wall biosynthesis